jgi:hypothetical protein
MIVSPSLNYQLPALERPGREHDAPAILDRQRSPIGAGKDQIRAVRGSIELTASNIAMWTIASSRRPAVPGPAIAPALASQSVITLAEAAVEQARAKANSTLRMIPA